MTRDEYRTVKGIFTKQFQIEMYQDSKGRYRIYYESLGVKRYSEWITDFGTASYLFDLKTRELEGN